ncbi:DNA sulfur modification protein DndB [Clostridium perfringens]|nr:DNA sulfur modification protein DndB [Clostridium perfringens]
MKNNFFYTFPALKGIQASREFFVIMCPLSVLSKLFIFNDDELPPEYRAQRLLNKSRIPEITSYMVDNPKDYVFSSVTASIDGDFKFEPFDKALNENMGTLKVAMDSRLLINDGQHRRAAIEDALKVSPELGNETISVVLFIDEGLNRSQQIFADLNKHAVNVSKSIGILYDSRDPIALITKSLIEQNSFLKYFTDREKPSLSKYSNKLFTLSSINETNKKLLCKLNPDDESTQKFVYEFWNCLCTNMKEWQFVFNKELSASNFRGSYVSSNAVVLEALGIVGNCLFRKNKSKWKDYLVNIKNIDWNRSNLSDWSNRAIGNNGRIVKNSSYVKLTTNMIKIKLGIELNSDELILENSYRKQKEK